MWMFLMMVCLLDQNQAAPLPWEHNSLQLILQHQLDQTAPSPPPGASSSSSSSSSSVSSESSQSSESPQLLQERQRLENTAVEQTGSSQESSELLPSPSNSTSSLWLNELVLVGERAGERDGESDTGDDSVASRESRRRALLLTFHPLLSRPRLDKRPAVTADDAAAGLGGATGEGGGDKEEIDAEFPRLVDDSTERADGLTWDSPGHAHNYHGNEEGLELGL